MAILIIFPFTLAYTLSNFCFRNLSHMLSFSVMVLAVLRLPAPHIIDHSDQKRSIIFFNINFNIIWHLTLHSWHWHLNIVLHWHLWQKLLQLFRKLCDLIDKTLVSPVTEKLLFESLHSLWQNSHHKTILHKAILPLPKNCFVGLVIARYFFTTEAKPVQKPVQSQQY